MFFFNEPDYDNLPSYQELGVAGKMDVGSTMLDTFLFEDLSHAKTRNLDNAKWQDVVKAQRAAPELFIEGYEKPELIEGSGHAIDIINQARKETYQLQTGIRVSDYDDIVAPNIEKLKELDPEIRNISEIDQAIIDKAKELREKYEKTAARASSWDAFWGSLGGGALGAMADPINIMTMPIGVGATSLAGGLLRGVATAFGKTAAIGMGAEAAIQPLVYDYKKEIDSPYDLGDALMNIAFAGVGEGILGGAGHVILRGFKRLGDKGEITNAQQRVGDYIKQIQDIADNNEVFTAKQLEAHVEALVTIEKDIREGRIPDIKQLNERIERIYLEDFGKVIHGTQAEIVELSAKRQELAQRFREDVYQQQKEWQSKFDGRMRPDDVEQAKSVQGSAYIGNKPGISLKAVRGAQKADWESGEAGLKLDAHNEAVDAHLSFKGSRKAHGDQVKLKERLGEMDVQLEAKTKYLDAAKKAREVYLKTQAEKARKAIPDAPTDNVKQKAFKQLVNRMLANMGATNIKVNVFNGSMPGVSPNARFSLDNGKGSSAWEAAKAKGLDMSHEARMERARAMGFDTETVYYHGTGDNIESFRESKLGKAGTGGVYLTDSAEKASSYAKLSSKFGERVGRGTNANIVPVYLRMNNPFVSETGMPYNENISSLKLAGYDSIILKREFPNGKDEVIVFDPSNIRSVNAAFDPDLIGSPNLRYSLSKQEIADMRALATKQRFGGEVDVDYRMDHTSPVREGSNSIDDLSDIYPDDIYSESLGVRYYGTGDKELDVESIRIIASLKGNPDAYVTIYRAVPEGVDEINAGDWVSINRDYADQHGASWVDNGKYKILEEEVRARDIVTNGDSIHEWGYDPNGKLGERFSKQGSTIEAAIDPETGELHLNIDAFESDEHLMRVLREEVIGHYGLRQTLGKQFDTVINDIKSVAYHNKELRQAWIDLSGVDPRTKQVINKEAPYAGMADEVIADELISKLAREEMTFSETTMAKLMSMLTKALRAVGLVKDPITMSEMKALVIKSERQLKKGATKNNTPITMTGLSNKSNPDADKPLEEILESEANATLKGEDEGVVMVDINGKEVNYYDSLKESQRQLDALDTLEICAL